MMMQAILSACLIILFLPSCKVGPKYQKPKIPVPKNFSEKRVATTKAELTDWWTFFNDKYLNKLIETALQNNFDLRITLEKIKEVRALYKVQNAKLFPEVDVTGAVLGNKVSKKLVQNSYLQSSHVDYFALGFDALWELDFWGKQQSATDAAFSEYQAQIEGARDIYIILLGDVAKTYIDIRTMQKKIDLQQKQILIDTQLLDLTKDRLKSGVASEMPETEQQAVLDESKNQLILLQTSFKQALNRLAILLGRNPEGFNLEPGDCAVPCSTKTLAIGLPSDLLKRRPDIRKAEKLLSAATERIGEAFADWFPSFSLFGSVHTEANTGSNLFSNQSLSWSFGPSVRLPIITFGRIEYNVKAKKSAERQALLTYAQSVVIALGDVEDCLVLHFNEKDRRHVFEEKLKAISRERDLVKSRFKSGLDNKTQYLLTEKNRIITAQSLTDAEQSVSTSLVSVYKALGGGW